MNVYEQEIIETIESICTHNIYDIFADFVEISALTIKASMERGQSRQNVDDDFKRLITKYSQNEQEKFSKMFGLLVLSLEEHSRRKNVCDTLGGIFSQLKVNNKRTGQFFTPASVAELCARTLWDTESLENEISARGYILLDEPSCGGGVMIMAFCQAMIDAGFNPQTQLLVHGTDMDRRCVCMTYLQLSLYGIPAKICHGNSLTGEIFDTWFTPAYIADLWRYRRGETGCFQRKSV